MKSNKNNKKNIEENVIYATLCKPDEAYACQDFNKETVIKAVDDICKILKSGPRNAQYINSQLNLAGISFSLSRKKVTDDLKSGEKQKGKKGKPEGYPAKYIVGYARMSEILRNDKNLSFIKNASENKENSPTIIINSFWNVIKKILDSKIDDKINNTSEKFSTSIDQLVKSYETAPKLSDDLAQLNETFMSEIAKETENEEHDMVNKMREEYIKNRYSPVLKKQFKEKNRADNFKKRDYEDAYDKIRIGKNCPIDFPEGYQEKMDQYTKEFDEFFGHEGFNYELTPAEKEKKEYKYAMDIEKKVIGTFRIPTKNVTLITLYYICKVIENKTKIEYDNLIKLDQWKSFNETKTKNKKNNTTGKKAIDPVFSYRSPSKLKINRPITAVNSEQINLKEIEIKKEEKIEEEKVEEKKAEEKVEETINKDNVSSIKTKTNFNKFRGSKFGKK